jgi:hypothetical protein
VVENGVEKHADPRRVKLTAQSGNVFVGTEAWINPVQVSHVVTVTLGGKDRTKEDRLNAEGTQVGNPPGKGANVAA